MPTKTLEFPGTAASLDAIAEFVRDAASSAGFDAGMADRLHLAVAEVATNVVTHAYAERGLTGPVFVSAEIEPETLCLHLEDVGAPYDPTACADRIKRDPPQEEGEIGGLGVHLTRHSVDAFLYERRHDRNRVTFVLNRSAPVMAPGER